MVEIGHLSNRILDLACIVHKELGPGLHVSIYQQCMAYELKQHGIDHVVEQNIPIKYKNIHVDSGLAADIIVANSIILELKAVQKIIPDHEAQVMTFLRMTGLKLGLIINFNVKLLRQGIKRIVM